MIAMRNITIMMAMTIGLIATANAQNACPPGWWQGDGVQGMSNMCYRGPVSGAPGTYAPNGFASGMNQGFAMQAQAQNQQAADIQNRIARLSLIQRQQLNQFAQTVYQKCVEERNKIPGAQNTDAYCTDVARTRVLEVLPQ